MESREDGLTLSQRWDVLGPFQIGTREATWGADPLEYLGGFHSIQYDEDAKFPSSLAPNGQVSWAQLNIESDTPPVLPATTASQTDYLSMKLTFEFPRIDWDTLKSVYGWAAFQWQGWARGSLTLFGNKNRLVSFNADNVLEFWVDDNHYFGGDYYAYQRQPVMLDLRPGEHRVELRLIRDVRVMGGVAQPNLNIQLSAALCPETLVVHHSKSIFPETVNGRPAGSYAAIAVVNSSRHDILIHDVEIAEWESGSNPPNSHLTMDMYQRSPLLLVPGQSRPLIIRIQFSGSRLSRFSLKICHSAREGPCKKKHLMVKCELLEKEIHEPHKITFLHPSGTVSYAILRPPSRKVCLQAPREQQIPIMVALHGAGVNASDDLARSTLDPVPDLRAWVIYPSGGTTWSGDDWHEWGFADVEAAVSSIPQWIALTRWKGPSVDVNKWFVLGHSNGGQGTWYALTHKPDKIIGAAPVSGYSSIQGYVPYQFWNEADPRVTCCVQNALRSFRHEILLENCAGIPVLQQHGDADDNVHVFHSRRLHQLMKLRRHLEPSRYSELEGKGHWYIGVETTPLLKRFFEEILHVPDYPNLPLEYSIVVGNPADVGPRGGLQVDRLTEPDQIGRIDIVRNIESSTWTLHTSNVGQIHFADGPFRKHLPSTLNLDDQIVKIESRKQLLSVRFFHESHGHWSMSNDPQALVGTRSKRQLGPLSSMLRSKGHFIISLQVISPVCTAIASQIARNLYQYFLADCEIVWNVTDFDGFQGNVISAAIGRYCTYLKQRTRGIKFGDSQILIQRHDGREKGFNFEEGLGVIFLNPLPNDRLETIVWGLDELGLRMAARLFPMLTGVGQPEFIVVRKRCGWEGAAGALAMGSFTNSWRASEGSFIS